MPYICLNCGSLWVVESIARTVWLRSDGDIDFDDDLLEVSCSECGSNTNVVYFDIVDEENKSEIAKRLISASDKIIELTKLLLEYKIELEFDTHIVLLMEVLKERKGDGEKLAMLLKLKYL